MRTSRIKPMSDKQAARQKYLHVLARFLTEYRAEGICEFCRAGRVRDPHHIGKRSAGRVDSIRTIFMLCGACHESDPQGVAILEWVSRCNAKYGITERVTEDVTEWLVDGDVKARARWPG